MLELVLLGVSVGVISGFFGIGGGTILIPLLLLLNYDTKVAIGIAVLQMVFSSVFGSYLNNKKGTLNITMVMVIGIGGFIGAQFSGLITSNISDETLEVLFLTFTSFALVKLFFKTHESADIKKINNYILLLIGFIIGAISMTIGVGGSLLLVPILVGFLHVPLKQATSAGLFFVVFSSISGLISHSLEGHMDYEKGVLIGLASLFGVYVGIHLKEKIDAVLQKKLLVIFYLIIVSYLTYRIFGV